LSRVIDCTMVISDRMWRPSWKVDVSTKTGQPEDVDGIKTQFHITTLHLSAHCGSHVDSPLHFLEGGPYISEMPLENFFGEAAVVDLTDKGELSPITDQDLENRGRHIRKNDIVLLKTGWTEKNAGACAENLEGLPLNTDYYRGPYPTRSMADWMVKKKVKAVGYDCPNEYNQHLSIDYDYLRKGFQNREREHVHLIHLSNGILQIEYLCNLVAIKKERVMFYAVPLKIKAEGSPVRAFAIEE
jgi:arylformamidase